jgi:V/A-type H+/Na+-transporting ATPase subunit C
MDKVARFAAVNTKVKVLEGKLLHRHQITNLVQCRDYREALFYLRDKTSYGQILKEYNLEEVHRGQLENILRKYYIENLFKLIHYFSGDYKSFFRVLFIRFETEDIKTIIRGKYIGKSEEKLYSLIAYESPLNYIDFKELITAETLEDAVEKLRPTVYYKHIAPLVKGVKEEGLFRMEMTLDFVYFLNMRKFLKKLHKEDREIIELFNGVYADLLNIQWIFRGKKYYRLKPEELLNYTIYDGYKLSRDTLKSICYTKSMEEFYELIDKLPYGKLFEKSKYTEYLMEKEILLYLKGIYGRYKKENKMNIASVLAYLELALIECRDIISLVENKRYNLKTDETLSYITATL